MHSTCLNAGSDQLRSILFLFLKLGTIYGYPIPPPDTVFVVRKAKKKPGGWLGDVT
jgi:hypothetical protein